jgi:hypothetical protein
MKAAALAPLQTKGKIMASTLFLRRILALDSASCALMGLAMGFGSAALAPLLGLPGELIRVAGLLLLPLACFIGWLASRPAPPALLVWTVIGGNLGWTAESFLLLGQQSPTPLGTAFVSAQALAVLGLATLETIGLRRARPAAA